MQCFCHYTFKWLIRFLSTCICYSYPATQTLWRTSQKLVYIYYPNSKSGKASSVYGGKRLSRLDLLSWSVIGLNSSSIQGTTFICMTVLNVIMANLGLCFFKYSLRTLNLELFYCQQPLHIVIPVVSI